MEGVEGGKNISSSQERDHEVRGAQGTGGTFHRGATGRNRESSDASVHVPSQVTTVLTVVPQGWGKRRGMEELLTELSQSIQRGRDTEEYSKQNVSRGLIGCCQ